MSMHLQESRPCTRLELDTGRREEFLDITERVEQAVRELGLEQGAVLLHVPHTTAAVTINEGYDPAVAADVLGVLRRLAPMDEGYAHQEGNSDSHVKTLLTGCSQLVPVSRRAAGAGSLAADLLLRVRRAASQAGLGLGSGLIARPPIWGGRFGSFQPKCEVEAVHLRLRVPREGRPDVRWRSPPALQAPSKRPAERPC